MFNDCDTFETCGIRTRHKATHAREFKAEACVGCVYKFLSSRAVASSVAEASRMRNVDPRTHQSL